MKRATQKKVIRYKEVIEGEIRKHVSLQWQFVVASQTQLTN